MTTLLDELSGYEFEDAVASLFRALGYEDVSVPTRAADEGRILPCTTPGPPASSNANTPMPSPDPSSRSFTISLFV